MAGTIEGGIAARNSNLRKNPNHYREIGAKGGKKLGVKKGFALMTPEQRIACGQKGGAKSNRSIDPNSARQKQLRLKAALDQTRAAVASQERIKQRTS